MENKKYEQGERVMRISKAILIAVFIFVSNLATAKSFLWEIKDNDNSVFLLGSIHLLKESDYPLDKAIIRAFDKSETVVFEADLNSLKTMEFQQYVLAKSFFTDGESLKTSLSPHAYKKVAEKLKQSGMTMDIFNMFKPWSLAMTLPVIEMKKIGYSEEHGLDNFLFRRASMKNKQIQALETGEFQISLFDDLTKQQQQNLLLHTIEELDSMQQLMGQMKSAWKNGEAKKLGDLNESSYKQFPVIMDKLLNSRNKNWIPHIVKLINGNKDAIVVVGAAHLPGDQGVLKLIEKRGYKAKQL